MELEEYIKTNPLVLYLRNRRCPIRVEFPVGTPFEDITGTLEDFGNPQYIFDSREGLIIV